MELYFYLLCLREIFYVLILLVAIIFCFFPIITINKLKDIKIKTYFDTNQTLYEKNNSYLNFINEVEDTNIYSEFFNKYNLKEDDKLLSSEEIEFPSKIIYRINISNIVFYILVLIPSIIYIVIICKEIKDPNEDGDNGAAFFLTGITFIIEFIIFLILFSIFLAYLIKYKNFENDFFDLYNNIKNRNEKKLFKNYYKDIFDLKNNLAINFGLVCAVFGYIILIGISPLFILFCCLR
jgi:hypothetical protein